LPSRTTFRRRLHDTWPYAALFILIILPLLSAASILAVRSRLFVGSGSPPSNDQLKAFLAFIGGGLATAATVMASLLTWQHNKRAERQLELDTVVKGLESLPDGEARVAGAIATMVLLGQQPVAMRVLEPAWRNNVVDSATATWLIGQVLSADQKDETAINEAASTLLLHASKLTDRDKRQYISVPGSCFTVWHKGLPTRPRRQLLAAMAETLLSQEKGWWLTDNQLMPWPASIFAEAMTEDPDVTVKTCAAVLLNAILECFPDFTFRADVQKRLGSDIRQRARERADGATDVPAVFWQLAERIGVWGGTPRRIGPPAPPGGAQVLPV
jgi:hypothetical protein